MAHPVKWESLTHRRCRAWLSDGTFSADTGSTIMLYVGPLSQQMAIHILLMNAVAPLLALAVNRRFGDRLPLPKLYPAVIAQLLVLWAWHAPPMLHTGTQSHILHSIMLASFLTCALWFWLAILSIEDDYRWRAILALLITSKLFCLLGVLLVFAPRVLYPDLLIAHPPRAMHQIEDALADQQLAGLFMLVACPATYVLAGIVIAARWFFDLDADDTSDRQVPSLAVREARHVG
jgi:putative membrane protein